MSDFEAELIHHAAPTLLGRKQSNLFSLPLSLLPKCKEEIALYGKKLAEKGICIVYLYSFKNRVFIMVYRQNAMMGPVSAGTPCAGLSHFPWLPCPYRQKRCHDGNTCPSAQTDAGRR